LTTPPEKKTRLDSSLVDRGLAASREKAQALILAGEVFVDGQKMTKSGHPVASSARIEVAAPLKYVSRGGLKLEAALAGFSIEARGRVCLDVGTSTGGFTDCLLQHGAARVHAVDTGAGQIDWKLRSDARVVLHEKMNARHLVKEDIGEAVSLVVCDVSFISVTLLLPALMKVVELAADWIVLVKPQFEAGREFVGSGGIVRDPAGHQFACQRVEEAFTREGFSVSVMDSPILGAEGNREFLFWVRRALGAEKSVPS
jgi:23S rRNA (cytidine1920-2'-O)/16S rRNA (cytidine1409-2'-O)-methyltransferase